MMRASTLIVAASALVITACGSDDASPGTTADTGVSVETDAGDTGAPPSDTGADPSDTAAGPTDTGTAPSDVSGDSPAIGCGTTMNVGMPVPETAGAGAYPTPTGGTLADGTYVLTKFEIYPPGSIDPFKRKQTLVISGGKVDFVSQTDTAAEVRFGGDISVSGTKFIVNVKCPAMTTVEKPFAATATEIKVWETNGTTMNEIHTFTKM